MFFDLLKSLFSRLTSDLIKSLFQLNGFYFFSRIEVPNVVNMVKVKKATLKDQKEQDEHINPVI